MNLSPLDYGIIFGFFILSLLIGLWASKSAGKSSSEFFLSGRNMPWWLLGVSMVATTFAADTPGLVTELVRKNGVSGNWVWWAMLLTGMLTVFFYAKLWRKSGISTDLEFYELRYSGKMASFLRGFRAIYLGVIFNIITMAGVCLAGAKIGTILLGISQSEMLLYSSIIVVIYSSLGGLKGVLLTDFVQFLIAMIGSVWATIYIVNLPEIDGLSNLLTHPNVSDKLAMFPDFSNTEALITLFIIPLAVQWWSVWYPGAEPGGGGYIAQRMLAAKDEKNATWATLFFNFAHYALRPWPWIIVGLASLVIFPSLESMNQAFPSLSSEMQGHDVGYAAMMTYLPAGLLGIVLTSLIAAFMSTISTQLNWGSSYIVFDFYKQQINPEATEKQMVAVGRISTIVLMVLSALLALTLQNAFEVFDLLVTFGAGTGLVFILRWFWWRINSWSEITAMFASGIISILMVKTDLGDFLFAPETGLMPEWANYPFVVVITTAIWMTVTFMTPPESKETLRSFYRKIQPGGPGWAKVVDNAQRDNVEIVKPGEKWSVPSGITAMILGVVLIYSIMFATGYWIYGRTISALVISAIALISGFLLIKVWGRMKENIL